MKKLVSILLAALLLLTGCGAPQEKGDAFEMIKPEEAIRLMEEEEGYVILDVRTQEEFDGGHIPGAVCLPNESIGTEPPSLLPDKGQLILVYCRSGNRSKQAAGKLAAMGYSRVVEFGGILSWPGDVVTE